MSNDSGEREFTRESICSWIKRKLGAPLINVELSDDQLNDCIDDSLDEVSPWIVQRQYITVPAARCIDLTKYKPAYVIYVHKASSTAADGNSPQLDVFNPYSYTVITSNRAMVYDRLEQILYSRSNLTLKDNISFKLIKSYEESGNRSYKLYLDVGYPVSDNVTIEYSPQIDNIASVSDNLYRRYIREFALAYSRKLLSDIRGKYNVSSTPMSLDASDQNSKADKDLDRLREELKDTVITNFTID